LAISYYRSFNLPVKIVRPFNTFGPRQSARAIIPTIITQILSGKRKINLGNLNPTRDLTFVKDTCKGFIEIYKSEKLFGEITNIGMKEEITISYLVHKIAKLLNTPIEIETEEQRVRPENSEVERLFCDNTKLISNTNWKPDYNLEKGLVETIDWLKKNIDMYKPEIYNV
jgi:dTDP-glucose 4,6-dehydratase